MVDRVWVLDPLVFKGPGLDSLSFAQEGCDDSRIATPVEDRDDEDWFFLGSVGD
jgi:hypothetical protein